MNDEEEKESHRCEEIQERWTTHPAAVAGGGRRRGSAAGGLAGNSFSHLSLSIIWWFVEKMKENGRLGVFIPRAFKWVFARLKSVSRILTRPRLRFRYRFYYFAK
jgi:hypothetical protein